MRAAALLDVRQFPRRPVLLAAGLAQGDGVVTLCRGIGTCWPSTSIPCCRRRKPSRVLGQDRVPAVVGGELSAVCGTRLRLARRSREVRVFY